MVQTGQQTDRSQAFQRMERTVYHQLTPEQQNGGWISGIFSAYTTFLYSMPQITSNGVFFSIFLSICVSYFTGDSTTADAEQQQRESTVIEDDHISKMRGYVSIGLTILCFARVVLLHVFTRQFKDFWYDHKIRMYTFT